MKKYLIIGLLCVTSLLGGCWKKSAITNMNVNTNTGTGVNVNDNENPSKAPIQVKQPLANSVISNPVIVKGEVSGTWYFEGSFPISVVDSEGNILAEAPAQAQGEWMTTEMVPFEVELLMQATNATSGFIIFRKDNPSGLPEHDASYNLPIKFSQ